MKRFWKAAGIRALRTMIQTVLAVWTAGMLITEIDWRATLIATVSAGVYSLLTSLLAGLPEIREDDTELIINYDDEEDDEEWDV